MKRHFFQDCPTTLPCSTWRKSKSSAAEFRARSNATSRHDISRGGGVSERAVFDPAERFRARLDFCGVEIPENVDAHFGTNFGASRRRRNVTRSSAASL